MLRLLWRILRFSCGGGDWITTKLSQLVCTMNGLIIRKIDLKGKVVVFENVLFDGGVQVVFGVAFIGDTVVFL